MALYGNNTARTENVPEPATSNRLLDKLLLLSPEKEGFTRNNRTGKFDRGLSQLLHDDLH